MKKPDVAAVLEYLTRLRDEVCKDLAAEDGKKTFIGSRDVGVRGGFTEPRMLEAGPVLERAAVHLTRSRIESWPSPSPERAARAAAAPYDAVSVSVIVHPRNPYAPAAHANLRFFVSSQAAREPVWWFGGGYDLTPTYGFEEDARHWHETARRACDPFGAKVYPAFKKSCDEYFYLPHRTETRGVGGLFFEDLDSGGFEHSFALVKSIGDSFLPAYLPILRARKDAPHGEREREFHLHRRGRYVEFNLLYDRGTRFGLAAGVDAESLLSSLPPGATWRSGWRPDPGSPEADLARSFLVPRDWI